MDVHTLDTKAGNKVVAMFWKHPFARFTMLYSHGNAADLGQMHELFIELRAHLRVNIMWYKLWEAVYNCLKDEYGVKQEELILYGQSVGSGPTLHLGSRLRDLRGIVLHSAILSGIRVLYPVKVTLPFDIFKVSKASFTFVTSYISTINRSFRARVMRLSIGLTGSACGNSRRTNTTLCGSRVAATATLRRTLSTSST
ncbi:unnamed protein product [Linum tenue]|uniref:Uncharacterized protein n=1 Tax=Linum tenue TaxID=586396 RepID=A0AAV0ICU8_9ROSI|nr:unnamed protein product [Linum tenue]